MRPQARTGAAIAADSASSENQTQSRPESADTAANSADRFGQAAAIGADTDRALGRLEGLALSGLEKSIALAVENAVTLAVAPMADEIRALRLQVEKQGREDATGRAETIEPAQPARSTPNVAQRRPQREMRPLWKVILGIRRDYE